MAKLARDLALIPKIAGSNPRRCIDFFFCLHFFFLEKFLTRKFCKSDSNTEIVLSNDDFDFPPASHKCRNLSQSPVADDSNTIDFAYG